MTHGPPSGEGRLTYKVIKNGPQPKIFALPTTLTIQQEPHQAPADDPFVKGSTQTFVTSFFSFKFIFLQRFYFELKTFIFTRPRHSLPLAGRAHRLFLYLNHVLTAPSLFSSYCFIPAEGQVLPQRENGILFLIQSQPELRCTDRTSGVATWNSLTRGEGKNPP